MAGANIVYPVASQTVCQNDDGTGAVTTNYAYSWYTTAGHQLQMKEVETTLPAVADTENGSNAATATFAYYNDLGQLVWSADQNGRFSHYAYDSLTGLLTTPIQDADAGDGSLSGLSLTFTWPTLPASGQGISQQTDYTYDALGRVTQTLGPAHYAMVAGYTTPQNIRSATWTIYGDAIQQTWSAQGYVLVSSPAVGYLVGPVSITKTDHVGRVTDQIQATYLRSGNPDTSLSDLRSDLATFLGGGANPFPVSSYVTWTANNYSHTHLVATAVYYNIDSSWTADRQSGAMAWTASASSPDATFMGTTANYTLTTYGYESTYSGGGLAADVPNYMGRLVKSVSSDGTITRYVLDDRGNVLETWMGTDDTGATDTDPGDGNTNGMVQISSSTYDADGNLLTSTSYADASHSYTTTYQYDFRDRVTDVLSPADVVTDYTYDNLDRVTWTETYASSDFTLDTGELRARRKTSTTNSAVSTNRGLTRSSRRRTPIRARSKITCRPTPGMTPWATLSRPKPARPGPSQRPSTTVSASPRSSTPATPPTSRSKHPALGMRPAASLAIRSFNRPRPGTTPPAKP